MIPRKVRQHLDEHLKNEIARKRQESMTEKWNFEIKKCENISFSCQENWTKVCN